jgi:hypothetical protein
VAAPLGAQVSVQITSPASGIVVHPGQTLNLSVAVSGGPVSGVAIIGELSGISQIQTSAPYQFSIQVPPSGMAPEIYDYYAVGIAASGPVYSAPIAVDLERPDSPVSISVQEQSLVFDSLGQTQSLLVCGNYADGTTLNISQSSLTTYSLTSGSPAPVTVAPNDLITSVAVGTGRIVVNGQYWVPVTVQPAIAVKPNFRTLHAEQQQQFYATVNPAANLGAAVSWSLSPAIGNIDASGLYTAPNSVDPNNNYVAITATSVADPRQSGSTSGTITIP